MVHGQCVDVTEQATGDQGLRVDDSYQLAVAVLSRVLEGERFAPLRAAGRDNSYVGVPAGEFLGHLAGLPVEVVVRHDDDKLEQTRRIVAGEQLGQRAPENGFLPGGHDQREGVPGGLLILQVDVVDPVGQLPAVLCPHQRQAGDQQHRQRHRRPDTDRYVSATAVQRLRRFRERRPRGQQQDTVQNTDGRRCQSGAEDEPVTHQQVRGNHQKGAERGGQQITWAGLPRRRGTGRQLRQRGEQQPADRFGRDPRDDEPEPAAFAPAPGEAAVQAPQQAGRGGHRKHVAGPSPGPEETAGESHQRDPCGSARPTGHDETQLPWHPRQESVKRRWRGKRLVEVH